MAARKPGSRLRRAGSKSDKYPYEQKRRTYKIAGRIVDVRVVPEDADNRLQIYHHTEAVAAR